MSRDVPGRVARVREQESLGLKFAPGAPQNKAPSKWERLAGSEADPGVFPQAPLAGISDARVPPLLQSKWSQGDEGAYQSYCYNYYTPEHCVCGCMATAIAQLMRYHLHPTEGVGTATFNITAKGVATTASLRGGDGNGGPYEWADMVLDPDASTTDIQRQAIGALCYDAGISIHTSYWSTISTALMKDTTAALVNTFGYSNARNAFNANNAFPLANLYAMINPNLDAALPVLVQLKYTVAQKHGVVADGYGYNLGTMYHHLNMGWRGDYDGWYNLPDVQAGSRTYNSIDRCGYNIFPTGAGEIISGRVTGSGGSPVAGATVTASRTGGGTYKTTTNSRGIYALAKIPSASNYSIKAVKTGFTFSSRTVSTGTSVNDNINPGNYWGADFTGTGPSASPLAPVYQLLLSD